MLSNCLADQLPVLLDSARLYEEWVSEPARLNAAPGTAAVEGADEPVIARFTTTLRGVQAPAMAQLHALWLLQNVRDWYDDLPNEDRGSCEALARDLGVNELMALRPPRRLARTGSAIALGS